jgi:hypothetical protein
MRTPAVVGFFATALIGSILAPFYAQSAVLIARDAQIYIDPADSFGAYLSAAIEKRHVPVTLTADRAQADYLIEDAAGLRLIDAHTSEVIFVWPGETKKSDPQHSADACAREMSHNIQSPAKHKSVKKDPVWDF